MRRLYCYTCQSAGSVNQWGLCEICGEEYENVKLSDDSVKGFDYAGAASRKVTEKDYAGYEFNTREPAVTIKQDAA